MIDSFLNPQMIDILLKSIEIMYFIVCLLIVIIIEFWKVLLPCIAVLYVLYRLFNMIADKFTDKIAKMIKKALK
jgi:hypothetical protein